MKKKIVYASSLLLAGSLLLSACSGEGASPADTGTGTPVTAPSGEAPAATNLLTEKIPASDISKLPQTAVQRTDTVIVGLTDPSGSFTPYFSQSGYDGNVASLLYTSLITSDAEGLPAADYAESYEVSEDGLTYTFHLPEKGSFSDGSPLTSEDVAFTWTLLHDKAYDGDTDITLMKVKGGLAYKEGKADSIEGINIIDPYTISVTLEEPNATALLNLGGNVLSKAYYGKDYKFGELTYLQKLHAAPLGNGPYILEKFLPGQEVRFTANEHYLKGKPSVERFIYKTSQGDTWQFLETGEVDLASYTATQENIDKLKGLGYVDILPYTPSTYGYFQLNLENEQMKEKEVRQAITHGLNRQAIYVDANQGAGEVANIPAAPISWSYTEEGINPYEYNPEKAKELLDAAGWTVGGDGIREKDGKKLSIHYLGSKSPATDIFIAVAKENFAEIGIDFQPEVFADFNALVSKVESKDYDMAAFSTPMLTDPSDGVIQFIDGSLPGYDNPKVKELYAKGLATVDTEERKAVYQELYQILNDELPVIFTSYRKSVYANNGRLTNVSISPYKGIAQSLPEWKIEQ
ncbi:ABC transporter substrate-binding protein [Paenibacillus sp. J45TS6]|uniref:ABC transporter substrate-binding protein n=1 Tax=Paenibacillus sp. J45TS6 TaxID=2807196 RepID=UPI001B2AE2AA|nr:ABC transporter substrate-binding protein [Paenibacillus sp. J45TS6]GIP42644.1 ABC transporter substrate-binding protein [Paenibacillus sp. J45TS6]